MFVVPGRVCVIGPMEVVCVADVPAVDVEGSDVAMETTGSVITVVVGSDFVTTPGNDVVSTTAVVVEAVTG